MNISHRSIWNPALGAWIAVSEITRACGKRSSGGTVARASSSALALAWLLGSAPALAGGDGGYGGYWGNPNITGTGWSAGSNTGAGGRGGNAFSAAGGSGGSVGTNGSDGANDPGLGGGGGGGGGSGMLVSTTGSTNAALVTGSNGGNGGIGQPTGGGGGGGGGGGVLASAGLTNFSNSGDIRGGNGGGVGGSGNGNGGGGGAGVVAATGLVNFVNTGSITGGNGGAGTNSNGRGGNGEGGAAGGDRTGAFAQGGAGIAGSGMSITNSGSISGGLSGDGLTRAAALTFTGGTSGLTLQTGSSLTGAIDIRSGATASIVAGNAGLTLNNALLLGGNASVDTNGNAFTLSGVISGTGGFTKNGAGTLTLTGTNNYTGGTTISVGTLALGGGSSLAAAGALNLNGTGATLDLSAAGNQTVGSLAGVTGSTVTLGANRLTVGDATSQTFAGNMGGTGGITKQGTGTQILTGSNNYTGGTTVSTGTLQGNNSSLQGAITNNAAVTFDQATAGTYAGAMSGSGTLSKTGAGTLTLTGTNNYTGGTTISVGTLALGGGSSLAAAGALNLNGTGATLDLSAAGNQTVGSLAGVTGSTVTLGANRLTVGDATSQTFAGNMGGTGGITKQGTGTQILTGSNNYTGGTTVSTGTLQGNSSSLQGAITNNAAVTFDQIAAGTYAGVMSGNGIFNKTGTGNLILTATHTLSGATNINAGTLSVNGSLTGSALTVNSGGILGGSGTVGNTTIASGGVLAPGNSIGTLTINGNTAFAAGSIYRVEVDAAGNNDRTNVTGSAALNGTVDVQAGAGTYAANTTYTILNATGGRTGNFSGVTSSLAFLTPSLTYDANNVFLSLARNDISFSAVAQTPNQIAASTALQNAVTGAAGDMLTVINTLTGLSAGQARSAYDSASGAGLVALRGAGAGFAAQLGSQVQGRLAVAPTGSSVQANSFGNRPILLAANSYASDLSGLLNTMSDTAPQKFSLASGTALPSASATQGRGFWLRGSGGYQHTSSDGNAAASKLRSTSLSAGFDTQLNEAVVVGAALSSGSSRLGFDNADAGKSRGTALAVYGSYADGPWAFKGSASAGWNSNHMDRSVVVGALNRQAGSDFSSRTLSAYGEAAYTLPMNGWTLQPVAGLSLSQDKTNGFTETGAGALNLQVAGQTVTSTKTLLGARASLEAGSLRLEPRVIWVHAFGDINTPMTAQFQGTASASPFQVSGVALKRDTLILGLGAAGSIAKGMGLFADVQLEHNSRQSNATVMVGLRANW